MKNIFLLLLLLLATCTLSAQNQNPGKMKPNTLAEAEVQMEGVYASVLTVLNPAEQKLLKKAQKDWLKYRESECNYQLIEANADEDKVKVKESCQFELTKKRINDLMASYVIMRLKE